MNLKNILSVLYACFIKLFLSFGFIFLMSDDIFSQKSVYQTKISDLEKLISAAEDNFFEGNHFESLPKTCDSILQMFDTTTNFHSKLRLKFLKAASYSELRDFKNALKYFKITSNDSSILKSEYLLNFRTLYLGIFEYHYGRFPKSMSLLNKAADFFEKDTLTNRNKFNLAQIFKFKGRIFAEQGIFSKGIEMYNKSLFYLNKSPHKNNTFELYRLIGRAYFMNMQFDKSLSKEAERNYLLALNGFKKNKIDKELPWMYTVLADFYSKTGQTKKAKLFQDSCMQIAQKKGLSELIGLSFNNYGEINILDSLPQKAVDDFKQALIFYNKPENIRYRIVTMTNLAGAYNQLNLLDSAEKYAKLAVEKALNFKNLDKIAKSYKILSEFYLSKNKYKEAFLNYSKFKAYNDSVYQKQNMNIAYAMREIYETEKKEKYNLILKNENQTKEYQIKTTEKRLIFITLISIVLILAGIFHFIGMKRKKELQLQKQARQALIEQFNVKEKTLRDTERELHSLTNEIIGVAKSIKTKDEQKTFDTEISILKSLDNKMRNIQAGLKAPTEIANFHIKLESYIFQQRNLYSFEILTDIANDIDWKSIYSDIQTHLYRITQLLLHNTNNHANASEVSINCFIADNILNFMYNDNGLGYNPQNVPKDRGLAEIFTRLQTLKAVLTDESREGNGCEISIEIPL